MPRLAPLVGLLALLLAGCGSTGKSFGLSKGPELSYGEVQAITVGLTANQVRDAFGKPVGASRTPDGRVTRMEYPALDGKGNKARLYLDFDGREVVTQKTFTGAIVRP